MMDYRYTRLRAYVLDGIALSYSVDMEFVLIGGRYNEVIIPSMKEEMRIAGCDSIDLLHIPSWDSSVCNAEELPRLLDELMPTEIEIPSYISDNENGKKCRKIIAEYCQSSPITDLVERNPKLNVRKEGEFGRVLSPLKNYEIKRDNDIIEFFNHGRFSILSTGFVESQEVVDDLNKMEQLHNPYVLLVKNINESPFVSMEFIQKSSPLMIIDLLDNYKFYVRGDAKLKDYGISTIRGEHGDIIITSGIRRNDVEINTPLDTSVSGNEYKTE